MCCVKHLRRNVLSSLLATVVIVAGCGKQQPAETPVARMDEKTLTLEDIRKEVDTTQGLSEVQVQQFIQRWLRDELLYQEAVKRGLDRSDDIERKVAEARRQLIINAYLEQEVYSLTANDISEEEVGAYYDAHGKEFVLPHDVVLLSYVLFKNRDVATEFRNAVVKGAPWSTALQQLTTLPDLRVDSVYYTQATLLPPELWRVAANIKDREASFPISTTQGFYVLYVWKYQKQGQQADRSYVEPQIRSRLLIERRKKKYDSLLTALRESHAIQVFTSGRDSTYLKSKQEGYVQ